MKKRSLLLFAVILAAIGTHLHAENALPLVPQPKEIKMGEGVLSLSRDTRIVCSDNSLAPLAKILAGELGTLTHFTPAAAKASPKAGDIALQLDPSLEGEAYTLSISDHATVKAGNYLALASATTTLLQLIETPPGKITLPRLEIRDQPLYPFRSLMIDLARKYHTVDSIEQVVKMCRFYKVRYLHLHLTDDNMFMFPSTKFPNAGKTNDEFKRFDPPSTPHIEPYTREEMVALDQYAREHGVLIIPEVDLPGHSSRLVKDEPEAFKLPGSSNTVNIASPKTLEAVDILLNEVMDVFQGPYIHLGADEVDLRGLEKTSDYQNALEADPTLKKTRDLFGKFFVHLHDVVSKRNRKALVWEEAWQTDGPYPLPKDVIVYFWNRNLDPNPVADSGYSIVNAESNPLYIVRPRKKSPEVIYQWDPTLFANNRSKEFIKLSDTSRLLGAQLTSWENPESSEIQIIRHRLGVVAERNWNPPNADESFEVFNQRLTKTDAMLDRLILPIQVDVKGTFIKDENNFKGPVTLTLTPRQSGLTLRYTLDGSLPGESWKDYKEPIVIEETSFFRAGLFKGTEQVGHLVGGWFHKDGDRND